MEKVSVIIPVYCQWELVKKNISALLNYDKQNIEEIIIVDDCSPEQNPYKFDNGTVRIIHNENNMGYTATVNNGLRIAKSEVVVVLDSDAYSVGSFIQKLISMYDADSSIGCVGFGTIDNMGNDTGNYQYESSVLGLIAGQFLKAKFGFLRFWRNRNILPNSCAISFRKTCLQELKYFDEKCFPVLGADIDISMRIHRSKWKLVFTRKIIICHKGGNSYKINYKRVLLYYECHWKLLKKFGLLWFPNFTKVAIRERIKVELLILKLLANKRPTVDYNDKIKGRLNLLKEIDAYE